MVARSTPRAKYTLELARIAEHDLLPTDADGSSEVHWEEDSREQVGEREEGAQEDGEDDHTLDLAAVRLLVSVYISISEGVTVCSPGETEVLLTSIVGVTVGLAGVQAGRALRYHQLSHGRSTLSGCCGPEGLLAREGAPRSRSRLLCWLTWGRSRSWNRCRGRARPRHIRAPPSPPHPPSLQPPSARFFSVWPVQAQSIHRASRHGIRWRFCWLLACHTRHTLARPVSKHPFRWPWLLLDVSCNAQTIYEGLCDLARVCRHHAGLRRLSRPRSMAVRRRFILRALGRMSCLPWDGVTYPYPQTSPAALPRACEPPGRAGRDA